MTRLPKPPQRRTYTIPHPTRFDPQALFLALDAQRQSRSLSWQQVAREIGVAASTMTRLQRGGRMEVDGMLAMVSWLDRSVESFTMANTRRDLFDHTTKG